MKTSVYVDSSVILNYLLNEPSPKIDLSRFSRLVTSELTDVECRRVLDRIRLRESRDESEIAEKYAELADRLSSLDILSLSPPVLRRAREAFPTTVRTLDALHLATAILLRQEVGDSAWFFATHDQEQANAAKALGFSLQGA